VSTLVNDSVEIVEIRRGGTEGIEVIDSAVIRGTEDVEDSKETTVTLDVGLRIEDHSTSVLSRKETRGAVSDDLAISIDLFDRNIDTSESKRAESEDTDKK